MTEIHDPFFQAPRKNLNLSVGEIAFPILYYETLNQSHFFKVPPEKARALLPEQLELVLLGGHALINLGFFSYKRTSIGVYNEVALSIMCQPKGLAPVKNAVLSQLVSMKERRVGFYITDLPVTTKTANAIGQEVWSYPKFVTDLPMTFVGNYFEGKVVDPERKNSIFKLWGRHGFGVPLPFSGVVTYSIHNDQVLRTELNMQGAARLALGGEFQLDLGDSDHRMAQHLRQLGLGGAKPFLVQWVNNLQTRLNIGIPQVL